MVSMTVAQEGLAPQVGGRVHVQLVDGQSLDGTLTRVDDRTLRLRSTGRGALVVVYRQSVAALHAASPVAA